MRRGLLAVAAGFGVAAAVFACAPVTLFNLTIPMKGYRVEKNVAYGSDPRQKLDLYIPDRIKPHAPVLLFFYGGSWQNGSKNLYLAFGQAFASEGIVVAIADYRVYPQVEYPGFIEDAASALAYVRANAARYGGDPARIFVAGHSAGAYNAVMLASDPRYLAAVHGDFGWIRGVIGIAGPYDFLPLEDEKLIALFGGVARVETQPIRYIDGKRPPMLLAAGLDDTTVRPANTERMAKRLRDFGSDVETKLYPGVGHIGIILSIAAPFRGKAPLRADMLHFIATH